MTDANRFVLLGTGGLVNEPGEISAAVANLSAVAVVSGVISGYEPFCLTVKGTRLSASGPVVSQPVTATVCGYNSFPIINGGEPHARGRTGDGGADSCGGRREPTSRGSHAGADARGQVGQIHAKRGGALCRRWHFGKPGLSGRCGKAERTEGCGDGGAGFDDSRPN